MSKIGLQLYTVRDKMGSPDDIAKTLEAVAKIGFKNVEACGWDSVGAAEFRRMCDDNGLSVCSTHYSFQIMQDDIARAIDEHQIVGAKYCGIGGLPGEYRESAETYKTFAKLATEIGMKLNEAGIAFSYHNHSFELAKYDGQTALDIMIDNSCGKCFKNELDLYWVQHGGGSPVAWINKLGSRAPLTHWKDMAITPDMKQFFTEVGEGNLDWKGILEACVANNVEYYIVEQDVCPGDTLESVAISFKNMKAMGID